MRFTLVLLAASSIALVANGQLAAQETSATACDTSCDSCCDSYCDAAAPGGKHRLGNLFRKDCSTASYLAIHTGWNGLQDYNGNDFEIPIPPPSPAIREGSFNDGWAIGGAIGRRLNKAVRFEGEFTFRDNTADQWIVNQIPLGDWNGHFNQFSLMANLYHDFGNFQFLGCTPYIGGGIGIAFLDGEFNTATLDLDIDEESFAFQVIAGASKQLSQNTDAFVEYRYLETDDFDLINVTPPVPVEFGSDPYQANSVLFGLRFYR